MAPLPPRHAWLQIARHQLLHRHFLRLTALQRQQQIASSSIDEADGLTEVSLLSEMGVTRETPSPQPCCVISFLRVWLIVRAAFGDFIKIGANFTDYDHHRP